VPALRTVLTTGTTAFGKLDAGEAIDAVDAPTDAPAWLFYTSGTTGQPKGAMLTHRSLLFATMAYYADVDLPQAGGALIHAAPMSHGSGLYVLPHLNQGATHVIPDSGHFDAGEMVRLINHHGDASFFAAPTMVTRLLGSAEAGDLDPTRLRTVVYGGGPMYTPISSARSPRGARAWRRSTARARAR